MAYLESLFITLLRMRARVLSFFFFCTAALLCTYVLLSIGFIDQNPVKALAVDVFIIILKVTLSILSMQKAAQLHMLTVCHTI